MGDSNKVKVNVEICKDYVKKLKEYTTSIQDQIATYEKIGFDDTNQGIVYSENKGYRTKVVMTAKKINSLLKKYTKVMESSVQSYKELDEKIRNEVNS